MKKLFTRFALLMAFGGFSIFSTMAETVVVEGIAYELDSEASTASVTYGETEYTGDLKIPAAITSGGKEYTVTGIGSRCFYNNQKITSVILPSTIKEIGTYAFCACYGMTSVNLEDTKVTELPTGAFGACWKLENITLPATLTKLASNPFYMPTGLRGFTVAEGNPAYKAIDGVLYTISGKTLVAYPFGKSLEVTVPEGTDSIGAEAFMNFRSMRKCTLPESLTYVGLSSFTMCDTLESINLPRTMKYIGGSAFHGNAKMTGKAVFDEGLVSLGASAFNGTAITEVEIPGSCKVVSKNAFYNCRQVTKITLHEGIIRLMEMAFLNCKESEIIIPNSVTTINAQVFAGNTNAKTLVVGSGVKSFDSNPFGSCSALTSVSCLAETPPSYLQVYQNRYPLFPAVVTQNVSLSIPEGTENAYKEAVGWKEFVSLTPTSINEVEDTPIAIEKVDGGIRISGESLITVYTLSGVKVYEGISGLIPLQKSNIYIIQAGKRMMKVAI